MTASRGGFLPPGPGATASDTAGYGGVSASSHPLATAAGVEMLHRGGTAADAAVATGLALAVVEPSMSHLGGQGNAVIHMPGDDGPTALDYYATAPGLAAADMYEWIPGPTQGGYRFHTRGDRNTGGPLSVAVPGGVAGWLYVHRRWGRLPLATVAAPAIRFAGEGTALVPRVAAHIADARDRLALCPESARTWLRPGGSPRTAGDIVIQPQLADTIRLIARQGMDVFYRGEIAADIVRAVEGGGGILSARDLSDYPSRAFRVEIPEMARYRGYVVAAAPASSSTVLLPILRILSGFDLSALGPLSGRKIHLLIEAMKLSFADRPYHSGDPAHVNVPVEGLLSDSYVAERAALLRTDRAGIYGPGDPWRHCPSPPDPEKMIPTVPSAEAGNTHTTHHSHVDRWGGLVSMTQSLGDAFGSGMTVPGRGIILNNAMKLFDPRPGRANSVGPGRRPATAPCPALVMKGPSPVMALGSPSGTRIINAVAQVLIHVIDHRLTLQEAVLRPRVHWSGDELEVEGDLPRECLDYLLELGHEVEVRGARSPWFGAVQAVARDPASGLCRGAADPRRQGSVAAASFFDRWL